MTTMAIAVAGMHRSGTSMVARLLNLAGVSLGPERDMIPAGPDNPEGFWEHAGFVAVNDEILARLGGTCLTPPPMPASWELRPEIDLLRGVAAAFVARVAGAEPWGWKDPRNSLTLPFWQRLIPDLRVVVCVRNPLEVAASLGARNGIPPDVALDLWLTHYVRLMAAADRCVVTHYDAYFDDPASELARVLSLLGIRSARREVAAACASVLPRLRHTRWTTRDLTLHGVRPEVRTCYRLLCAAAGPGSPEIEGVVPGPDALRLVER
jgi:hypothetical protein